MFSDTPKQERKSLKGIGMAALIVGITSFGLVSANAQSSSGNESSQIGGYTVNSSIEVGLRGGNVTGSEDKFRSDLNYKKGLRLFDSSVVLERKEGTGGLFDSFAATSTGWGSDPSGFTRINMEKLGAYKFDSNFRRIVYFNRLNNHVQGQRAFNTVHNLGDFDITLFPQSDLRFSLGGSYNDFEGNGLTNSRAYSDEFVTGARFNTDAKDLRAGVEAKVLGFNLGFNQGYRSFRERSQYVLEAPTPGNNTTNNARFDTFFRRFPINGSTNYSLFNMQRTFAKKLDMTGQFVYQSTRTFSEMFEQITGRDNSNNIIDLDDFYIFGDAKRIQTRGNLGVTYAFNDSFRISNTFSYDEFSINGGEFFREVVTSRTAAGAARPTTTTNSLAYRLTDYRRFSNLIEGDYQFNRNISAHVGYRYTDRRVGISGFNRTLPNNPTLVADGQDNRTNTVIGGMKIKPIKRWTIFWSVEHGTADNIFTRTANYDFTNFKVRSRWGFDKVGFSVSAITKDNLNPTITDEVPARVFGADINTRTYSAVFDWTPSQKLMVNTGYTYMHLTSQTDIIVPVGSVRQQGISRFFIRDHNAFLDVSYRPNNRLSFYGSYRINKDMGQGDRTANNLQNITSGYPLQFQSPEFRMTARINRSADLNIGYQYYDYKERFQRAQDYRAHLPYVSLRLYLGRADR